VKLPSREERDQRRCATQAMPAPYPGARWPFAKDAEITIPCSTSRCFTGISRARYRP